MIKKGRPKTDFYKKCLICNSNFRDILSNLKKRKYCSIHCKNIGARGNKNVAKAVESYKKYPIFCKNCGYLLTKNRARKFKMHIPQCPIYIIKKRYKPLIKVNQKEFGKKSKIYLDYIKKINQRREHDKILRVTLAKG